MENYKDIKREENEAGGRMEEKPLISIIIRTCGRPNILKRAIDSVVNQKYNNIEIVIVEDGFNLAENMLENNYSHIRYKYFNTSCKKGRTVVGNIGLKEAGGEYFNFLDDDDILLPQHLCVLIKGIIKQNKLAAYSIAEEHQIKTKRSEKYPYKVKRKIIRYAQPYNKLLLCYMNYLPIQSILFHRSLFEQYGGFDETLNVLEDWDIWVRYSMACDFLFIPEVTSIYYTPYKSKKKQERDILMKDARKELIKKYKTYDMNLSAEQIYQDMDYLLNVFHKKNIIFYMKKIRDFLLYRDI